MDMESTEIELPSGKKAVIQEGKGKHLKQAIATSGGDQNAIIFALIAQLTTIDGKRFVMEDLDEMPMQDVLALMAVFGENF